MSWIDSEGLTWKSFSLTHVVYPKGDLYGKFLALVTLSPFAIVVAFFTLAVFVRDIHVILFFAGQLTNEALNSLLKMLYAEARPLQFGGGTKNTNDSFGWPSSHCQFLAFFATYSTLGIYRRRKLHSKFYLFLLLCAIWISTFLVAHSRIYLRYHYTHQCFHGLLIGSSFALWWYLFVTLLVEPFVMRRIVPSQLNQDHLHLCSIYLPAKGCTNSRKD